MKKIKFPTAQTMLFIIAALVAVLTWVLPSGQYDTLEYMSDEEVFVQKVGEQSKILTADQETLDSLKINIPLENFTSGAIYKPIGIPNTYREVTAKPQGILALLTAPVKGIIAAADIIFLVLIIGGLIGIMNLTGAFDAGLSWLAHSLKGREYLLIVIVTLLIGAGGTTFGMAEETIAFYPILIPVFLAARYDAMVGLACIFLGSAVGSMCSTTNPFSAIIASDAAGISWTTGLYGRLLMLLICLMVCILYIMRYASRVQKDPSQSIVYDQRRDIEALFHLPEGNQTFHFSTRMRIILVLFGLSFVVMVAGVSFLGWWFAEMTATFLIAAVLIGFAAKIPEEKFVDSFTKGAGDLLGVGLIIGIARGISILMDDGMISDTVLYYTSGLTEGMNKGLFANVMLFVYGGLSFFMPSSSGMAVLTMPIFAPLADTVDLGREVVVDVYMYGMGLFYFINPTSLILPVLALVKIGFDKWLKFVVPLLVILTLITMAFLTVSVYLF